MAIVEICCFSDLKQDLFSGEFLKFDSEKCNFRKSISNLKLTDKRYLNGITKLKIFGGEGFCEKFYLPNNLLNNFNNLTELDFDSNCSLFGIEDGAISMNPQLRAIVIEPNRDGQTDLTLRLLKNRKVYECNNKKVLPYEKTDLDKIEVFSYNENPNMDYRFEKIRNPLTRLVGKENILEK